MKTDRYLDALERVTSLAVDRWDVERMRDALGKARENLERKAEGLRRAEFSKKLGK